MLKYVRSIVDEVVVIGVFVRDTADARVLYVERPHSQSWLKSAPSECVDVVNAPLLAQIRYLIGSLLYGRQDPYPTDEQIASHDEAEDASGHYGMYPSPVDCWMDCVEIRNDFLANGNWWLLRWRVATAKLPFTRKRKFLFPRPVYRVLHPGR